MLWTGNLLKAVALKRFLTPGGGIRLENCAHRDDGRLTMKSQLIAIVAAVVLVGCGASKTDLSLIDASESGNIEDVKEHLADGANVNAKDDQFGWTPLHFAASTGHNEIVELLIAKGAEVDSKDDKYGVTPLHYAASNARDEIAELLITNGADVNAKSSDGATPLHLANSKKIVELLIAKGADVNAKDKNGRTPLDWSVNWNQAETADLLRKHGGKTSEELKAEGK
jgi:ankyrin repeat protein